MASPMASSSIMAPGRAELCLETILNLSWSLAACAKFPILLDPRNFKNVFEGVKPKKAKLSSSGKPLLATF